MPQAITRFILIWRMDQALISREAGYWDTIATNWREEMPHSLWRAQSDAINIALLERWLPPGRFSRVLKTDLFDEFVSEGLYSFLASRTGRVVGMDVSMTAIRAASSRCARLQAAGADARFLPFVDGAFDVIVSNSTLDHFETPDEIIASLRELKRVLQIGGHLIITLDNLANPIIALRNALPFGVLHRFGIVPYYVGPTFGIGRLKSALEELQFEVIEVTSAVHFPRVLAVALAKILEKYAPARYHGIFLRFLTAFEHLAKLPTKFLTGHFVAAMAVKRS